MKQDIEPTIIGMILFSTRNHFLVLNYRNSSIYFSTTILKVHIGKGKDLGLYSYNAVHICLHYKLVRLPLTFIICIIGVPMTLSRFKDVAQVFVGVLFWMAVFFWASAWDGRDKPDKGSRFRR
ncbi:hypothetical protein DCAR_0729320 [Daucus carota subsp. sativus]|uniref:Uncharacterized protein n=1 Tax=Daucus carota subsp. sativus TaxID=79200 RepID=A0AAF1B892_DAUCS|nr:hypothetical protein DCAR_0729320 [Daucus carota subsp. sativus]